MKRVLLTDLQRRYTDLSVGEILHKACFLDPRFKSLSFFLEETKRGIMLVIKEEAVSEEERNESGSEEPAPKRKCKFMSLLEDVWEPEVRANPEEHAKKEVEK